MVGTLKRLPAQAERKEGTTSSHHGPYAQGYTRATMARTACRKLAIASQSRKARLSSDCRLQLACMKLESLVIAHQQWRGEYVPGPCTHRPSSHGSWGDLKAVAARRSQSQKTGLSSDWSLQLDSMKSESLVIANQHEIGRASCRERVCVPV